MNEDIESLMVMVQQLEQMTKNADNITQSTQKQAINFIELGKEMSDLKHRVKQLEDENAFLRFLLKDHFGCNT